MEEDSTNGNEFQGTSTISGVRTSAPLMNVAMHIDPTYFSQNQSSSMPNSLIFPGIFPQNFLKIIFQVRTSY